MDKSQLLILRTPLDADSKLYIFNSPIDYSDEHLIVYQYAGPESGYCVVYKRDHYIINNPPNYHSPTKRSFLNECIRQLYIMNGLAHKLHWEPNTSLSNHQEIWQQVNTCLQPEHMSPRSASLQRVKRQLFRESEQKRKRSKTLRSKVWGGTQGSNFKSVRHKIPRRHVKRDYLKAVRPAVLQQLLRENLKQEMINTPTICQSIMNAAEGIFKVNTTVVNQLTDRAKRMEATFLQEQVRRAMESHQAILEESVRSIFYAKQLFKLIKSQDAAHILESGCC